MKFMAIGEVLWDIFPNKKVWGGAPANAIFYAQELGVDATMHSAVGNDALGEELLQAISSVKLNLKAKKVKSYPTGSVHVTLDSEGNASYEIVENSSWDFIPFSEEMERRSAEVDLIIFGTLAQRNAVTRETIYRALENKKSSAKILCDLNLRQAYYSREILEASLKAADFLKINEEELEVLKTTFKSDLNNLVKTFELELLILTLGADGSEIHKDGHSYKHAAIPGEVVDTVGAGDSFTSCFITQYLMGIDIPDAQKKASELAAHVCAHAGATVGLPDKFQLTVNT